MPQVSPIIRLTLGVTLLTISLLLMLDHLGFLPNQTQSQLNSRKVTAELLAVQVSSLIGAERMGDVETTLTLLNTRHDDVSSVALRRDDGSLLFSAGDHAQQWEPLPDGQSTLSDVAVPIFTGDTRWGAVEIRFADNSGSLFDWLKGGSIGAVILLIGALGFLVNWIFLKRALRELDPTAVVPERVSMALDILAEGLVMIDRSGRIVLTNTSFQLLSGVSRSSLMGVHLSSFDWSAGAPDTGEPGAGAKNSAVSDNSFGKTVFETPWDMILEREAEPHTMPVAITNLHGETIRFAVNAVAIRSGDGIMKGVVVTFDDITDIEKKNLRLESAVKQLHASKLEIERKKNELEVLATRDSLTGVLNRRSLFEGMHALVRDARLNGKPLSCIMTDIDHFKKVNDTYGHATGDEVIKLMAGLLTEHMDPTALVGRYGGEEFVIVLPDVDETQAALAADRLRQLFYACETLPSGKSIRLSASFGVASDTTGQLEPSALVDNADKALYKAKESGRNRVVKASDGNETPDTLTGDTGDAPDSTPVEVSALELATPLAAEDTSSLVGEQALNGQSGRAEPVYSTGADRDIVLEDRISQGIERSKRFGSHAAVMFVSIEAMDVISSTAGSGEAVKLMQTVSERITGILRATDAVSVSPGSGNGISVSRMGVTELIVVVTDIGDTKDITWIGKRVSEALTTPVDYNGSDFSLDARMGISLYPGDGDHAQNLISNSRIALRNAKLEGSRNSVVYFDENMNASSEKLLLLENQLQCALEREELYLVYQPLIDLTTGRIGGFETLVRWKSPIYGLISPVQFIPIAEQSGLIRSIGLWIFQSAAKQLKAWRDSGFRDITLSVNFSAVQLLQDDLYDSVIATVRELDLPPESMTIEITESAIIDDLDTATRKIKRFQEAGFRIALDDFGTGYSSLVYLKQMSINSVKIDRSFFIDFPTNQRDAAIVAAIITLSHDLGLTVVAEGVETEEQLSAIAGMRCDTVQGYVFSAALSRQQASLLLDSSIDQRRMMRVLKSCKKHPVVVDNAVIDGVLNEIDSLYRSVS